jgi:hypothetical protein
MTARIKAVPITEAITARVLDLSLQATKGEFRALRRLVLAMGGEWIENPPHGPPIVRNVHGMNAIGISTGYDVSTFVQVATVLFGPYWAMIPELSEAWHQFCEGWSTKAKTSRKRKSGTVK